MKFHAHRHIPSLLSTDSRTLQRYTKDMVYAGNPRYVYTAGDWQTVRDILVYCNAHALPVTFCGSQTSMTGSSVADDGVVIALSKRDKILDISSDSRTGEAFVITEPGVILGDLKRAVQAEGFFYPPDPTSFNEAQVGATVATNATGEETFKFGPTRTYVQELDVMASDGKIRTLPRTQPPPHTSAKNTAGYFMGGEEIDEVIGSEGTLGLITRLKLKLLRADKNNIFILILPFSRFDNAIKAVTKIVSGPLKPRAIELIGPGAGAYFRRYPQCPEELKNEEIFLYIKDDYGDEEELSKKMEAWFKEFQKLYHDLGERAALERVFVAQTAAQLEAIRECRHFIPLKVNEEYFPYAAQGGGKVGTDWWVPINHLEDMMRQTHDEAVRLSIPFLVFAHIGSGHPHWNFLTRTPEEKNIAREFVLRQCRQAVLYGGGVAGEHGIGKIKRDLISIQHSSGIIHKMTALKTKWDPKWILGRGNILTPPRA